MGSTPPLSPDLQGSNPLEGAAASSSSSSSSAITSPNVPVVQEVTPNTDEVNAPIPKASGRNKPKDSVKAKESKRKTAADKLASKLQAQRESNLSNLPGPLPSPVTSPLIAPTESIIETRTGTEFARIRMPQHVEGGHLSDISSNEEASNFDLDDEANRSYLDSLRRSPPRSRTFNPSHLIQDAELFNQPFITRSGAPWGVSSPAVPSVLLGQSDNQNLEAGDAIASNFPFSQTESTFTELGAPIGSTQVVAKKSVVVVPPALLNKPSSSRSVPFRENPLPSLERGSSSQPWGTGIIQPKHTTPKTVEKLVEKTTRPLSLPLKNPTPAPPLNQRNISIDQSAIQSLTSLFLQFETKFSQMTSRAEETLRHAEESAARRLSTEAERIRVEAEKASRFFQQPSNFYAPPSIQRTVLHTDEEVPLTDMRRPEERERDEIHSTIFGPQPFLNMDRIPAPETQQNTLYSIWANVDATDILRHLKLLTSFDPLSQVPSLKDYLAWYSSVQPSLAQHANYTATYLLTRLLPPAYVERAIRRYNSNLPVLPLKTVVRIYGQDIYSILKQNPLTLADQLKVGRDRLTSQVELYQRVVELFFCRSDRVQPIIFCYELVIAIGQHQSPEQRALFLHNVITKYPGLQQAAEAIKGTAMPFDVNQEQSLKIQDLPMTAAKCEQFANWLLTLADVRPIPFRSDKKEAAHPRDETHSKGPPTKKPRINQVSTSQASQTSTAVSVKSVLPVKEEVEQSSTSSVASSPSNNSSPAEPEAHCTVHPKGNHTNAQCMVQHKELRPKKTVKKNNSNNNIPSDLSPDAQCPIHPNLHHNWGNCRKNPANASAAGNATSVNPAPTDSGEVKLVLQLTTKITSAPFTINSSLFPSRKNDSFIQIELPNGSRSIKEDEIEEVPKGVIDSASDLSNNSNTSFIYQSIPFFASEPLIRLLLNDLKFIALGDSGSGISLISVESCRLFPVEMRFVLKNKVLCLPFNFCENNISTEERLTKISEILIVPVQLNEFQFLFPFFIFPGEIDYPIIGRDFLHHTSLSIHCLEKCFKYIKGHQIPLYKSPFSNTTASNSISSNDKFLINMTAERSSFASLLHWKLPAGSIKCSVVNSYYFTSNKVAEVLVQSSGRPIRPFITYQLGIIPFQRRHQQFELITKQLYIDSAAPPDILSISILPLPSTELIEGELFIWLLPLQQTLVNSSSLKINSTSTYPLFSDFKPEAFRSDFPLPTSAADYPFDDYTSEDYQTAELEIDQYVFKENQKRFLQPRPGLRIPAGNSELPDSYLVLTAKALAALPAGVWYQECPDKLPGIPETDVVIPVSLTTTQPVYHKPRRLNPQLYSAVATELQHQEKLGLIKPVRSSYASPIVVVPKPGNKIRICTDYRELNKIAEPDRYPLPLIEDVVSMAAGCKYMTLLDLPMGFQQLHVNPADRHKLAFITPMGHFEHIRLPYGFLNGPSAFQREYDVTLGSMRLWSRPYIDDLIVCDTDNHKRHDAKLQTFLFNCFRRGLAVHADKSKALGTSVVLLGMKVDAVGVTPYIKDGVFSKLKSRKHSTLQHLQQTIGSLQWYRRFIPSFSFIIKPLLDAVKEMTSMPATNNHLDDICLPIISKVEELLNDKSSLAHPSPFTTKEIHLIAGNCAFATTLYQSTDEHQKEVLEHWSKVWPLNVRSYTIEERYALAVRETITRFRSIIQHSPSILIFTPCSTFTVLTHNESFWSPRIAMMLFIATTLPITFRTETCSELPILNDDSIEPLSYSQKGFIRQEIASFFQLSQSEVDTLPKVFTDGSCITKKGTQKFSGFGVFWGEESPYNLSKPCEYPPFTNNRAELEGILAAVTQARHLAIRKYLVYSDSQISVDKLNVLHNAQLNGTPVEDLPPYSDAKLGLANTDLLKKILFQLDGVKVSFQYIPRILNSSADALSRLYWASRNYQLPEDTKGEDKDIEISSNELSDEFEETEDEHDAFSEYQEMNVIHRIQNEDSNPYQKFQFSTESSFPLQHLFQIQDREPGVVPEKGDFNLMHDKRIPLPSVPLLDSSHYLNLISQLPALQVADPDLKALRNALLSQNPLHLPSAIANFYPNAFIAPNSQLIWIRDKSIDKILVPVAAQLPLIELLHSSPQFGSHCGISPTLRIIKRLFIWTNMKAQITEYCKNCQICKSTKTSNTKVAGPLVPLPLLTKTFHRIHVDSIVGLPMTAAPGRYTYVLVIVDAFTKFLLAFPLTSIQHPQIIRCFNSVFTIFGSPLEIISDNGLEFKNKYVAEFLHTWGVTQRFTTPYNPQSNGQAEAMVKIIVDKLKIHLRHLASARADAKYLKGSWAAALPQLIYSYNITPQKKLGASPYELLFGRLPPVLTSTIIGESKLWEDVSADYCNSLKNALSNYHANAAFLLFKYRQLMKKHFDLHRPTFSLEVGDYIYIGPTYASIQKKLSPAFEGPFRVEFIQRNEGTQEVTGACVNTGTIEKPILKWYPRYRIRLVGSLNPSINWSSFNSLK